MENLLNDKKICAVFVIFVFIVAGIFTFFSNTIDMDYWARILQGRFVIDFGKVMYSDPFSYTPTHTWLDHEWGSGVLFAFIQKHIGFTGILALRTLITAVIFMSAWNINKLTEKKSYIFSVLILFLFLCSVPTISQSGLRCHFFTFLFFTLYINILEYVRKGGKNISLIVLPAVMLFWSNMHGGCVSGLGLLVMYAIGELFNKKPFSKYLITLLACLSVMLINPYGINYVKFIFMAATMQRPFVTEWISPFMHPCVEFMLPFKIFYIINFILLVFSLKNIKTDYTKYIVLLVCAYLSCRYVKNCPFFIIVSLIFLKNELFWLYEKIIPLKAREFLNEKESNIKFVVITCLSLILFTIAVNLRDYSADFLSQQPVKVVEFMKINKLDGKVISPFDMGSYIAYKRFPNNLIYMDGRYEEVYFKETKDLIDLFFNADKNWFKILELYPSDYIIVPSDALINDYLSKSDEYKLIYIDEYNYLYAKKEVIRNEYKIPPKDYRYYLKHAFESNFLSK